jgi:hypothetical protein
MALDASARWQLNTTTFVGNEQAIIQFNSSGSVTQALNTRDSNASANNNSHIVLRRSDDTYLGSIGRASTDTAMFVDGNSYLSLRTGATERARISSGGDLLVGTTSSTARLTVKPSSGLAIGTSGYSGDLTVAGIEVSKFDNDTTTSQVLMRFAVNNGGAGQGQINANGALTAAFGTYSDKRLKENIVDLPPQLSNIMALRPVEFDYIASEGGGHQIGFIAQEFEEVYPDAIGERADGMKTLTGWSKTDARLIKALQEAMARIEQLEAKFAALETK